MKKLPIGIQTFSNIIREDYIYVDKTEGIFNLIQGGQYYFLSRPGRFGKSVLVSTLKEIFLGNRELFSGLWIEDKISWEKHPVIHLDFSVLAGFGDQFEGALNRILDGIAAENEITLPGDGIGEKFKSLLEQLGSEARVVVLIDEYDKPINNYIEDTEKAAINREILKTFYSVVKASDPYIKFFFLTGVSRFREVSLFSDLNNLDDITLESDYSNLLGYTEEELRQYFGSYIERLQAEYQSYYSDIYPVIRRWYNGYSWDGKHFVYNPFSILNLLKKRRFMDYWFSTGTPTFLMKLIRKKNYSVLDLRNQPLNLSFFNKFEVENLEINALLFQTGYLTLKKYDFFTNIGTLDFPNREVEQSFNIHLLAEFSTESRERNAILVQQLSESLESGNPEGAIRILQSIFKSISYPLVPGRNTRIEEQERFYHAIFHSYVRLLGVLIESEVLTIDGRIDAIIRTKDMLYVVEFKIGSAGDALAQIKSKAYHLPFTGEGKRVLLWGIGFNPETRNIGEHLVEEVGG